MGGSDAPWAPGVIAWKSLAKAASQWLKDYVGRGTYPCTCKTFSEKNFPTNLVCRPKFRMIEAVGYIEGVAIEGRKSGKVMFLEIRGLGRIRTTRPMVATEGSSAQEGKAHRATEARGRVGR